MPVTGAVLRRAGEAFDPPQRALEAIHLATLIGLGLDTAVLLTYDAHQAAAAGEAGLEVRSPA